MKSYINVALIYIKSLVGLFVGKAGREEDGIRRRRTLKEIRGTKKN